MCARNLLDQPVGTQQCKLARDRSGTAALSLPGGISLCEQQRPKIAVAEAQGEVTERAQSLEQGQHPRITQPQPATRRLPAPMGCRMRSTIGVDTAKL